MISEGLSYVNNFVLFIMESASNLGSEQFDFLKTSYKQNRQSSFHAMSGLILHHGSESAFTRIALAACSNPVRLNNRASVYERLSDIKISPPAFP